MTLKKLFRQLRTSPADLALEDLREFCSGRTGTTPIAELQPRQETCVVGEISSLRIVPRAGSPSLEATITDGSGTIVAVWLGRRQIAGVSPGGRVLVRGRANPSGPAGRLLFYNPYYELL